jgi:accessory colonization factor AcfC
MLRAGDVAVYGPGNPHDPLRLVPLRSRSRAA